MTILILILVAILYSTEKGRELLYDFITLPFVIIGYPFRLMKEEKEKTAIRKEQETIENFKKSLTTEDLDLIQDIFILDCYFTAIREQIDLYKKFENGELHKNYLKPEVLLSAHQNNSLYIIKPEKIEELRKKL